MYDCIIIHYSEIGIKGKNRVMFENRLKRNLSVALGNRARIYKRYGRLVCDLLTKEEKEIEEIKSLLKITPGVANFGFAKRARLEFEDIKQVVFSLLKKRRFGSFKVLTKRSYKEFPMTSLEINKALGEEIAAKLGKRIELKNPELTIYVEICEKESFVYLDKLKGVGGLPVGCGGKVVCLLSGGIDSPTAAFLMMKRGCPVVLIHFFNRTINTRQALKKVEDIANVLASVQIRGKLYLVPFYKLQAEIIKIVPAKYRMIIYRRLMMEIANKIAENEKAQAIVTGDSIGQVASQTLENLRCIYTVAEYPVFAPLIGMNKEEIVDLAKTIGTYEISIRPYQDCCSFMIAEHPATKMPLKLADEIERNIKDKGELILDAVENAEVKEYKI